LGTSNIFGGLFGAYPAFGALSRTNLNDNIGGRTQISSNSFFFFKNIHFFK